MGENRNLAGTLRLIGNPPGHVRVMWACREGYLHQQAVGAIHYHLRREIGAIYHYLTREMFLEPFITTCHSKCFESLILRLVSNEEEEETIPRWIPACA